MTREEIREAIEELDDEIFLTIIDCCKELNCDNVSMLYWDRDTVMDMLDKVLEGYSK